MWNQKGSNSNTAWTWAKTTTNSEVPFSESSKTHSHSLQEVADILSWLFQDVQSTGTAPNDCSNLTSSFTTELTIKSFLLYPQVCTGVLQEQNERDPGKDSYSNGCAPYYVLHCCSSQHKLNPKQLPPQQPGSQFESHLAVEAATQPVMVSSFRY